MTNVLDLNTGEYTLYTLSPIDAVIAAYAQKEKHNFNTWTYGQYSNLVKVFESSRRGCTVVSCGNQSCLSAAGREMEYPNQDYEASRRSVEGGN